MCLERKIVWLHMKYLALPNTAICKKSVFFLNFLYIWIIECLDMPNVVIWIMKDTDNGSLKNRVSTIPTFV